MSRLPLAPRLVRLLLVALLAGCGGAELVAPAPLRVLDTFPSNGASIPAADAAVVVTFSEDVEEASLEGGVVLEETTQAGVPLHRIDLSLSGYSRESFTATFEAGVLPAGSSYALTVLATEVRAVSGATLLGDLRRRFRTQP